MIKMFHIHNYVHCYLSFPDAMDDYIPVNTFMGFSASQRRQCIRIIIFDDSTVEQREYFVISLERLPGLHNRISISPDSGDVVIPNDDGEIIVCTDEHYHSIILWRNNRLVDCVSCALF